ncbi:uncharacterized protein LY89DRAFT_766283 [Mollisia scopiformis]|uniref:Uncharacterized protein n=1 Tax=Mollisia scopiformis TaxID=149040 RepID=A0A132B7F7_MOLSC|nr:uncharacterized protein LY89DRAFT_766283 [Mollisia scopiformis]KUJ07617.1 hypothetical protein LY89DRAFT_766283 [Mollisia scopiformis]
MQSTTKFSADSLVEILVQPKPVAVITCTFVYIWATRNYNPTTAPALPVESGPQPGAVPLSPSVEVQQSESHTVKVVMEVQEPGQPFHCPMQDSKLRSQAVSEVGEKVLPLPVYTPTARDGHTSTEKSSQTIRREKVEALKKEMHHIQETEDEDAYEEQEASLLNDEARERLLIALDMDIGDDEIRQVKRAWNATKERVARARLTSGKLAARFRMAMPGILPKRSTIALAFSALSVALGVIGIWFAILYTDCTSYASTFITTSTSVSGCIHFSELYMKWKLLEEIQETVVQIEGLCLKLSQLNHNDISALERSPYTSHTASKLGSFAHRLRVAFVTFQESIVPASGRPHLNNCPLTDSSDDESTTILTPAESEVNFEPPPLSNAMKLERLLAEKREIEKAQDDEMHKLDVCTQEMKEAQHRVKGVILFDIESGEHEKAQAEYVAASLKFLLLMQARDGQNLRLRRIALDIKSLEEEEKNKRQFEKKDI